MSYPVIKKTWKNFKCILLSERSQSKKATYCMTFWKRQNYEDSKKKKGHWLPVVGVEREMNRQSTEDF